MKRGQFNKKYPNHFDFGASLRKPTGESSFARVVRQYKANAKRRKLIFNLSDLEIKELTNEMSTVIRIVKPRWVFVENSPMLLIRGLGTVLRDLAEMGFNAKWGVDGILPLFVGYIINGNIR